MLNRVVLTGRLTRDPEVRVSQSNVPVGTFNLAVNRTFADKNGERGADFINCVTFNKQAENVGQYLEKGSLVGVDGRLQSRSYENKEGRTIYVTEVVCDSVQFLEPRSEQSSNRQNNQSNMQNYQQNQSQSREQNYVQGQIGNPRNSAKLQPDDDLPF